MNTDTSDTKKRDTGCQHPSPIGDLTLVASEQGLVGILWATEEPRWEFDEVEASESPVLAQACRELDEYFAGTRTEFEVALDLRGTEFQEMVWQSLADISFGDTVSYAKQAANLGRPSSVRAIASANGRNPIPIMLPCHRVIGSNGSLTGYAGGLDIKRWLLNHESGATLF